MKTITLLTVLSIACVAVSGCGNKGPLVKPSAAPAEVPEETQPVAEPAPVEMPAPAATPDPEPVPGTPAAPR